jgi:hypothetical protein
LPMEVKFHLAALPVEIKLHKNLQWIARSLEVNSLSHTIKSRHSIWSKVGLAA